MNIVLHSPEQSAATKLRAFSFSAPVVVAPDNRSYAPLTLSPFTEVHCFALRHYSQIAALETGFGGYTPSLDFSLPENSMYLALFI